MTYDELVTAVQDYCENTFAETDMNTFIQQAEQRIYNTVQLASLRKNMTGTLSANNKYLTCPNDFLSAYSLAVVDGSGNYEYLLNKDVNFIRQAYPNPTSTGIPKYYAIFGPATSDATELSLILGPTPDTNYSVELHFYYYPPSIVKAGVVYGRLAFPDDTSTFVDGAYTGIPVTGGSGSGLTVSVVVTSATGSPAIASITADSGGEGYAVGDNVQLPLSYITGGTDTNTLELDVLTVQTDPNNTTWLGDNFDSALLNGTMVEAIRFMKGEADMVKLYQDMYISSIGLLKNLGDGKQRMDAYRDGQVRIQVN